METLGHALDVITSEIATGQALDGLKIGLYTNQISPTPDTVITDLTEAAFTGYARSSTIVWGTPYRPLSAALYGADAPRYTSINTDPSTNVNVYGAFLVKPGTPDVLEAVIPFDTPVVIAGAGAGVSVVLQARYSPSLDLIIVAEQ